MFEMACCSLFRSWLGRLVIAFAIIIHRNTNETNSVSAAQMTSTSSKKANRNAHHNKNHVVDDGSFHLSPRGMVVCAGEGHMLLEALSMLVQVRHRIKSNISVTVAHCNELSNNSKQLLEAIPDVTILDLCDSVNINPQNRDRLKGFFCKPMALLRSPYQQVILADTDVIWFKPPELLFNAPSFIDTGALFFRDRLTITKNKLTLTEGTHSADRVYQYINSISSKLLSKGAGDRDIGHRQLLLSDNQHHHHYQHPHQESSIISHNLTALAEKNAYWRPSVSKQRGSSLDHMQDSSVVVLEQGRHPRMLKALKIMIKEFSIGYGDKEMYWLAATAAMEPHAFEPYAAGSLGDCGALLHFDPSGADHTSHNSSLVGNAAGAIEPFYTNAEYLVDLRKINKAGDFLGTVAGGGLQRTLPLIVDERFSEIRPLTDWRKMEHGFYPCGGCQVAQCIPIESYIFEEILASQQRILDLQHDLQTDSKSRANVIRLLKEAFGF